MSESIHNRERKPQAVHFCCVCTRDITGMRRVRDPKGRYFCKRCYVMGQIRKEQLAAIRAKVLQLPPHLTASPLPQTIFASTPHIPARTAPTIIKSELPLSIPPTVTPWIAAEPPAPESKPESATAPTTSPRPAPAPNNIISFTPPETRPVSESLPATPLCPLCNDPLPLGQRVCAACTAEMPNLERLLALREQHSKVLTQKNRRRKLAKSLAIACVPIALASVALIAFGHWFTPRSPFDQLPTTRAQAVEELLADIQDGSDPSYDRALALLATHSRDAANSPRDQAAKSTFKLMHDDFLHKYGPAWLATAQVENLLPDDDGEIVPFSITINNDVYHILSQALTSTPDASSPHAPSHFPENGKQHFGIFDIQEYAMNRAHMFERPGPLKLRDPLSPDSTPLATKPNPGALSEVSSPQ